MKFSINGWVCIAFRARRTRAATCEAEQWVLDIFTLQLHTLQMTKARHALEMMPGYKWAEPSGFAVLESYVWSPTVSVVDISHSQTSAVIHLQARGQATPTHATHEACCGYRFLVTHPKLVHLPQALPLSILLCPLSSYIGPGWKHQGTLRAHSSCVRARKARAPSEDLPGILVDWCHGLSGANGQQNGEAFEGWCIIVAR